MERVLSQPKAAAYAKSKSSSAFLTTPDGTRLMVGRGDHVLIYTTIALVLVGLMSVFTASAAQADYETGNSLYTVTKQVVAVAIGFTGMFFLSKFPFHKWGKLAIGSAIVAIGLLVITMFMGTTANGSERWIPLLFGFQFQPSDVAKVAAILLLAKTTSQKRLWTGQTFINLALVGVMILLIFKQPNLSVALILSTLTATMFFVAGLSLVVMLPLFVVGGSQVFEKIKETPYQWARIQGWLDPWKDPMDTGYNLIQSYYAIGSGGLLGVGLGHSIQKLYYLPFQHTDFIFSVICEEWGFVGALIVLGLFGSLAWRGFSIAWNCPHRFGQMLAFGLTLALILQALINICVTVGLMPVTGVTLPLISYGGTSMVMTLSMIGILLNVSRYRVLAPATVEMED